MADINQPPAALQAPPEDQGPQAPPADQGPQAPAADQGPQAPPEDQGPQAPPADQDPQAPPADQDPQAPPADQGPQAPAAVQGPQPPAALQAPPEDQGPQAPPADQDPQAPPADQGPQAPAAVQGPQAPPEDQGPQAPAADQDPQAPPADQGPQAPAGVQGPQAPPEDQGPQAPAALQAPPEDQGPQAPPADQDPQAPPADQGPQAPAAVQGPQAPPEDQGPQAPAAVQGPQAPPEDQGPQAPAAVQGPQAPPADQGPQAPDADQGPQAPPADQGSQAPDADQGPQAPPADQGPQAPPADQGPQAPDADQGPQAPPADQGPQAPPADQGPQAPAAVQGPQAPPADQGPQAPDADQGPQAPPADQGSQAPDADQGPQAPPADQGPQAPPADQGSQAPDADQGPQAPPADQGPQAPPADQGPQAPDADQGPQAPPADQGPQAPPADQGPQAPPEFQGPQAPAGDQGHQAHAALQAPAAEAGDLNYLDQQAGPANQNEPRPSHRLPGSKPGTWVYTDGDGFYYYSDKTTINRRQLRCTKHKSGCLARASMGLEEQSPIIPTRNSPYHNHIPDFDQEHRLTMINRPKERAREERGVSVSQIFADEANRNPDAALTLSRLNAARAMYREKKKTEPPIPQTIQDLTNLLHEPRYRYLSSTIDGRSDFFRGTILSDEGEVLATAFGSQRLIDHLREHPAEASTLFMDATFKVVPRRPHGLRQLFSIHVLYMNVVFPVAFFVMLSQTEEAYTRVLQYGRDQWITWQVSSIITDFERGLINAVRRVFIGAEHHGCWFHFCQAVWRSVIRLGLANLCRQNDSVMRVMKMIMALPHLPPRRGPPKSPTVPPFSIREGLNAIVVFVNEGNLDGRLNDIIAYVRRFWVRQMGTETFSVFALPRRTNNHLESFHAKLLSIFGPHSSIWVFIQRLQQIEQEAFNDFGRVDRAIEVRRPRVRSERLNPPSIREAMRRLILGEITLVHFLRTLAHRVDNVVNVLAHPRQVIDGALREDELAAVEEGDLDGDLEEMNPDQPNVPLPGNNEPAPPEEDDEGGPPIPPLPVPVAARGRGRRGRPRGLARGGRGRAEGGRGQRGRAGRPGRPRGRGARAPRGRGRGNPDDPPQPPALPVPHPQICAICMGNVSTHIAVPCGHLCMCQTCAIELPNHQDIFDRRCPLCNIHADSFIRVFF